MPLYEGALVPVPDELDSFHAEEIASFSGPGTWLTGEERLATVEAARDACVRRGLLDDSDHVGIPPVDVLPVATLALVEHLAATPGTFTRADCWAALSSGMAVGEYVETVSLVSRVVNIDVFARGIGCAPLPLLPARAGDPSFDAPATKDEGAFVPTVPAGSAGGNDARAAYGGPGPQPFIYRALSFVPAESRRCITGGTLQYLPLAKFTDFSYSHFPGLTRAHVELVAARVSALNDCFYWTTSHCVVLRASIEASGTKAFDMRAIVDRQVAWGEPSGEWLLRFADGVVGTDRLALDEARRALLTGLGDAALMGAAAVAGNFSRNDRIANGIGIRLEREFVEQGAALRAELGLDRFPSARNTLG